MRIGRKQLTQSALALAVVFAVAIPLGYNTYISAKYSERAAECGQYYGKHQLVTTAAVDKRVQTEEQATSSANDADSDYYNDRSIELACDANAIARANFDGGLVTALVGSVTVALAAIATIAAALQVGGFDANVGKLRQSAGVFFEIISDGAGTRWFIWNAGTQQLTISEIAVALAPPGTEPRSLFAAQVVREDLVIRPGKAIPLNRSVPFGTGDLFVAARYETLDGHSGLAWARFILIQVPGSYEKKEEGITHC